MTKQGAPGRTPSEHADGRYIYGLQWAEERDIRVVRVRVRADSQAPRAELEYWFRNWPYSPPQMPTIEDPVDDPWQGRWLKAFIKVDCQGAECRYTFEPLEKGENPLAPNLPGLAYRRTLKVRLVFKSDPHIETVQVLSGSQEKAVNLRLEWGPGKQRPIPGMGPCLSITDDSGVYSFGKDRVEIRSRETPSTWPRPALQKVWRWRLWLPSLRSRVLTTSRS